MRLHARNARDALAMALAGVDASTVFLVSFPRSGNTWARMVLTHLLVGETDDLDTKEEIVPAIGLGNALRVRSMGRPRIIKSHRPFDARFANVIYLLRDQRDVLVSLYHYQRRRSHLRHDVSFEGFIADYFRKWPVAETWHHHAGSWLVQPHEPEPRLHVVRYEDMLVHPHEETRKLCGFIGINASEQDIAGAIQATRFDELRRLEDRHSDQRGASARSGERFFRAGKSGQWRGYFDDASLDVLFSETGELMRRFGYER